MLSDEQKNQLKKQLIEQIDSKFSDEQKSQLTDKINSLSDNELEQILKQSSENTESPFRLIASGKIPSYKIGENEKALAVLEINPISKGHAIIVPKEKLTDPKNIPKEITELSSSVSDKIKSLLKPKKVDALNTTMFGEIIINILPVYKDENMSSERKKADEKEIKKLQKEINSLKIEKPIKEKVKQPKKKEEKINEKNTWLPKRVP